MKTIQIYTDDTRGVKETFQVIAAIWGEPQNCKLYSDSIEAIIKSNDQLGSDFKGLHAYNLNADNWTTLGIAFQEVIEKLFKFITTDKLNIQITLVSQDRYYANAGYLKNLI